MSTRMAPVSVDRINNEVYVGQLLFPNSIQSAVNYAVNQGVAMDVIVPQGYTGSESIEAITGGASNVNIIDERFGQRQAYLWYNGAYLAEPMTQRGGLSSFQLNHYLFVGTGRLTTIQSAIDYATFWGGSYFILITTAYTGTENISDLTGANNRIFLSDQRTDQVMNYHWDGFKFVPATLIIPGDVTVPGTLTVAGATTLNGPLTAASARVNGDTQLNTVTASGAAILQTLRVPTTAVIDGATTLNGDVTLARGMSVTGDVHAANVYATDEVRAETLTAPTATIDMLVGTEGHFDEMLVDDSPVRTFANSGGGDGMIWPTAGIAVSTGEEWVHPSLDPAKLLYIPITNNPQVFTTAGLYLGFLNGRGQIYNQSGGGGNSGMDWYSVDANGNKSLLAQFSSGQLRATALVATATVGSDPIPNSVWLDNAGRSGRMITVGPSVGQFNGIDFLGIDSNSSNVKAFAQLTVENDGVHFRTDYVNTTKDIISSTSLQAPGINSSRITLVTTPTMSLPGIGLTNSNAPLDEKLWAEELYGSTLRFRTVNDANNADFTFLSFTRIGASTVRTMIGGELWINDNSLGTIPGAGRGSGFATGWNVPMGTGNTAFVNYNGGGGGGYAWHNVAANTDVTDASIPDMALNSLGDLFLNQANANLRVGPAIDSSTSSNGIAGQPLARVFLSVLGEVGKSYPGEFIFNTWSALDANSSAGDALSITHRSLGPDGASASLFSLNGKGRVDAANAIRAYGWDAENFAAPNIQIGIAADGGSPMVSFSRPGSGISRIAHWGSSMVFQINTTGTPLFVLNTDSTVQVNGALNVGGAKNFKIPHPLDPDNKWLIHSSFEGPELGLIYRGEAETIDGTAEIELPHYFEALVTPYNRTVQITEIDDEDGTADFAMFKASRVRDGKFTVKSSVPSVKFCWQVMAVRGDIPAPEVEPTMSDVDREQKRRGKEGK